MVISEANMRFIKILCFVLLLGGISVLAIYIARHTERAVRSLTLEVLRSIPQAFLVLQTQREIAVATLDSGNILLGPRVGHAVANRRTYLGLDLEKVAPEDIEVVGNQVSVQLPTPAILDSSLDYGSVRLFTKRSGFMLLRDLASGRSIEIELLDLLSKTTPELTGENLKAQRLNFVDRLNRQAGDLFRAKGLSVEFR